MKKILIMGLPDSGKRSLLQAINDTYNGTKKYTLTAEICPTVEARSLFNADITIWCDTVENTNDIEFQRPQFSNERIHCYVTNMNTQFWANHIINTIL
jgi:hypothetical protein|tara:strand:+ start:395 stop:688 length:294 start_codon:yes stop_codon:yes gene_type:complete